MKTISDAAMAAIEAGTAIVAGAVEILCDPPLRVWSGHGTVPLDGADYQGLGAAGMIQQTGAALGGTAQGLNLSLSGIDPKALQLLDAAEIKDAAVVIRRLIFASDGKSLLDYAVWDRGRVDTISSDETVGGTATITVAVESAARGLGRSGGRMRSDSDQRLISATDGYFKRTAFAGQKMLYWGGKKPQQAGGVFGQILGLIVPIIVGRSKGSSSPTAGW